MIPTTSGLLDSAPTLADFVGGSGDESSGASITTTDDGDDDDGYYGQEVLQNRDSPDIDHSEIDDDGFQGEDSWQDYDENDTDGTGSRYDRETPWTTDAALQFDAGVVDSLTVPDLEFSDEEREAFADPGQTLADIASGVQESVSDGVDATPSDDAPDSFDQSGPGVVLGETSGGVPSWLYGAGAALVIGVLGLALRDDAGETDG